MKISKTLTGAVAASLLAVSLAAPADAQRWRRHRGGSDLGEALAVMAVIGGAAAIIGAAESDRRRRAEQRYEPRYEDRYDYGDRYGYSDRSAGGTGVAADSCGAEASRQGAGAVRITGVERGAADLYWVQGVVERDDRYAEGRYDDDSAYDDDRAYDGADRLGDPAERYYDRERYARDRGITFTCEARGNGRITDFAFNRF